MKKMEIIFNNNARFFWKVLYNIFKKMRLFYWATKINLFQIKIIYF